MMYRFNTQTACSMAQFQLQLQLNHLAGQMQKTLLQFSILYGPSHSFNFILVPKYDTIRSSFINIRTVALVT